MWGCCRAVGVCVTLTVQQIQIQLMLATSKERQTRLVAEGFPRGFKSFSLGAGMWLDAF